jgi:hypothetical protein
MATTQSPSRPARPLAAPPRSDTKTADGALPESQVRAITFQWHPLDDIPPKLPTRFWRLHDWLINYNKY